MNRPYITVTPTHVTATDPFDGEIARIPNRGDRTIAEVREILVSIYRVEPEVTFSEGDDLGWPTTRKDA